VPYDGEVANGFSAHAVDTFIGTNLSAFTSAEIPDLAGRDPQAQSWLSNFILNSMLRARPPSPEFEYRFLYFRRLMTAFDEYDLAREQTLEFLALRGSGNAPVPGDSFGAYFRALHHWEQHLMAAWQSLSVMAAMVAGYKVFTKGDGTVGERLNSLYNSAKHAESRIQSDQMPEAGPLAVWLTNDGISSTECEVQFSELADLLTELATWAFVFEDPLTTRERLEGLIELEKAVRAT
jgi:hypothetical protein